jgi:hypothetical protein
MVSIALQNNNATGNRKAQRRKKVEMKSETMPLLLLDLKCFEMRRQSEMSSKGLIFATYHLFHLLKNSKNIHWLPEKHRRVLFMMDWLSFFRRLHLGVSPS